ncbi:hypothetical protein SAMN04488073_3237 [Marinobacter gudaonensis]|uniref:Uncharacterized protein n=1 Tax=Marinobacter gudaonensis TaxID=375760 RepID=A0A1I6HZJ7_9GAMM|nr:DUF6488 family protein [Marinobacter gudaonensis]SFR59892.1 hypothetical protein SAMN04488073_3237 [Marinobacter gudaonensis]
MKRATLLSYFPACLLLFALSAGAHEAGHYAQHINEQTAMTIGLKKAQQFAVIDAGMGFGLLAPSWQRLNRGAVFIHSKDQDYYIVRVDNPAEKQSLYLAILSDSGELHGANWSGEFPDL